MRLSNVFYDDRQEKTNYLDFCVCVCVEVITVPIQNGDNAGRSFRGDVDSAGI